MFTFNNGTSSACDVYVICSGSSDKTIRFWDLRTTKELTVFNGHSGAVNAIYFSQLRVSIISDYSSKNDENDANTDSRSRLYCKYIQQITSFHPLFLCPQKLHSCFLFEEKIEGKAKENSLLDYCRLTNVHLLIESLNSLFQFFHLSLFLLGLFFQSNHLCIFV
ncbi:hypothetical protein RFI_00264 [Reticulomyxa filosa]|uniref:Uncharacterized protein n=1 Tax=Reticulomyxa filosa TaxID=46433 RepID=X6PFG0_RETFI|nr:hypothetical protein RFI_00264 [Reticulomyxa filosa]|eukprot:ETO36799.1 hypothetical protein RFI_00264 [Reticulomyxa filosa]